MERAIHELPSIFKPIGTQFTRKGVELVVVPRPKDLSVYQACEGCYFRDGCNNALQCSRWDRRDNQSVWFQQIISL